MPFLKKIDPKGEATLPLVRAAAQDKQLRVRAGLIRIAFDKEASLPISVLVEAFQEGGGRTTYYYPPGDKDDGDVRCGQKMLAAWLLWQAGVPVRQAVPALVETLRYTSSAPERADSFPPFEAVLKTDNKADWFASTLTVVDPQGEEAIPLLVKILKEQPDQEQRRNAICALGHYGTKAKVAIPVLLDIVKNKDANKPTSSTLPTVLVSRPVVTKASTLHDVAVDALIKIDPAAINTKEPPLAGSTKSTKKGKKN